MSQAGYQEELLMSCWSPIPLDRRGYVCMLVTQSCQLLVTPWIVALQAPLSMGFSRQEYWREWVDILFSRGWRLPSHSGMKPRSTVLQADALLSELLGKRINIHYFKILPHLSSVQSLSRVWLFVTPWIVTRQASLLHHQLPEFTQTQVHRRWCHPAISSSVVSSSSSQSLQASGSVQWVNSLHEVTKVLEIQLQHQSFQWTLRTDLL